MTDVRASFVMWQLSERAKRELHRNWPNLATPALENAGQVFLAAMSIQEERGERNWEHEISRLAKTSNEFLAELEKTQWSVFSFGMARVGGREVWLHELTTRVTRVFARLASGYAEKARQIDRRGTCGPRTNFILTVRRQLQAAGYGISARVNDDLVRVLDLMFCELEYPVVDVRKSVAHAIDGVGIDLEEGDNRFPPDL